MSEGVNEWKGVNEWGSERIMCKKKCLFTHSPNRSLTHSLFSTVCKIKEMFEILRTYV